MFRWLRLLLSRPARPGSSGKAAADRSRLMGMYLNHANRHTGISAHTLETQERKNGKFAANRRRG